jgi:hypothetical protein
MVDGLKEKYEQEIILTLVKAAEEVQKTLKGDDFLKLYGKFRTAYMTSKGTILECDWNHKDEGSYTEVRVMTTKDYVEQCVSDPYVFLAHLENRHIAMLTTVSIEQCVPKEDLEALLKTTDLSKIKTVQLKAWG